MRADGQAESRLSAALMSTPPKNLQRRTRRPPGGLPSGLDAFNALNDCCGCSGDLLPPSPRAEKTTARRPQGIRKGSPRAERSLGGAGGIIPGERLQENRFAQPNTITLRFL
jgi:hypothetical protein